MNRKSSKLKRIGVLTGGGDCPGLNAAIRAVVKTAINDYGAEVFGFEDGYYGLIHNKYHNISYQHASGILSLGGTILGTSNKISPFDKAISPHIPITMNKQLNASIRHFKKLRLDALFCIGGGGTLSIAEGLSRAGIPVIGIPKTIDNDLCGTDFTFGFNTAVQIASDAIDRLHSTAMSHHRVMIVEVMGRYAGWLALYSGISGGGDIILIPEIPYIIDTICKRVRQRHNIGKRFSIVIVSEGAKPVGGSLKVQRTVTGSPDPIRLGGIGRMLAYEIEQKTRLETRVTALGHLQRGGTPTAYDRVLATQFGVKAVHMAARKEFGRMVALRGSDITSCLISEAVSKLKLVPPQLSLITSAVSIGTSFGV
ncbi:MAG: ATP-dependent 6-phosphofructokinase [bacterium]